MKRLKGFFMLFLLGLSLFLLLFVPIEMYRTIKAQTWQPVEVEIVSIGIRRVWSDFTLEVQVRDLKTGVMSNQVAVRYGDIDLSLIAFSSLARSTKYVDLDKYARGKRIVAFRSAEGASYVLEQNTITLMTVVFLLACVYPAIAMRALIKRRSA